LVLVSCQKQEFEDLAPSAEKLVVKTESKTLKSSAMVILDHAKIVTSGQMYNSVGFIKVKNIAYDKQVIAWYLDGTEWKAQDASYLKSIEDGYEIWTFTLPAKPWSRYNLPYQKFAIKYVVNGQEYWDNNNGNDYVLQIQLGSLYQDFILGSETMVKAKSLSITPKGDYFTVVTFEGQVQNIDYEKQVLVVFTTDNWATRQIVEASYDGIPVQPGTERWKVTSTIPVASAGKVVKAYIQYSVSGQTFWDNNYTSDYIFDYTN
jgi:hypothetical protein